MYKKAFLHVGYDKNGSTALQITSTELQNQLRLLGIHYPKPILGNNHKLIASAFFTNPTLANFNQATGRSSKSVAEIREEDQQFLSTYERQIEGGCGTLFLSFEGLIWLSIREHIRLRDWISKYAHSVKVIVYVRDPVSYAESAISQRVRTGRPMTLSFHSHHLNIPKLVKVYGRNNVIVREFGRQTLEGGDVRYDCYSLMGLEKRQIEELICQMPDLAQLPNQSLSMHAIGIGEALRKKLKGTEFQTAAGAQRRFSFMFGDLLSNFPGPNYNLSFSEELNLLARPQVKSASRYLLDEFGIDFRSKTKRLLNLSRWLQPGPRSQFNALRKQGFYAHFANIFVAQMSAKMKTAEATNFADDSGQSVRNEDMS